MNRFTAYRPAIPEGTHNEDQANAPDEPQYEGVVFADGSCVIRWMTAVASVSVWDSFDDCMRIHGHPEYGTCIVFHDKYIKCPWDKEFDGVEAAIAGKTGEHSLCSWFLLCANQATGKTRHPVLGMVPVCDRCSHFAND